MQENNPNPTPEITTPVAIEQPKQSNFLIILLSVLLLISVSIAGFFAYQTQKLVGELNKLKIDGKTVVKDMSDPVETQNLEIAATANWKEYINDDLKISFKLPLELVKPGIFSRVETPSEKGTQVCWALDMRQGFRIVSVVNAGGGSCTLNQFTIGATSADHEAGRMSGFADYKFFQKNTATPENLVSQFTNKNGLEIIKIIGEDGPKKDPLMESGFPIIGTPGGGYIGAIVKSNVSDYQVFTVQMKLTNYLTEEVFDQILSTFKFLE